MGGFYAPTSVYYPDQLGGLSAKRFAQAVTAEFNGAFTCWEGGNFCLHTHKFFKTFDLMHAGQAGRIAFARRDVREDDQYLKPSEERYCIGMPWFKLFDKEWIDLYAAAYRKVVENYAELLEGDIDKTQGGRWHGSENAADQQK